MLFLKIICAFKMFWFGFCHSDLLTEQTLTVMASLLEYIFKCVNDNKPYCTHLYIDKHRIASLWAYPGLSRNPIDRIAELLSEIDALKGAVQQSPTVDKSEPADITPPCYTCGRMRCEAPVEPSGERLCDYLPTA